MLLTPHGPQKQVLLRELVTSSDETVASLMLTTLTYETEGGCNDGPRKSAKEQWSGDKLKVLTEFILFHTSGESLPNLKQDANVPVNLWKVLSML